MARIARVVAPGLLHHPTAPAATPDTCDPRKEPSAIHTLLFAEQWPNEDEVKLLRLHERTGRPLGSERFTIRLGHRLSRVLRPQKHGRKPKEETKKRKTKVKRVRSVKSSARRSSSRAK